jgi:hypothetical protein
VIKREKLACHKCPRAELSRLRPGAPKIVEKGKLSDAVDRRCAHQEYHTLRTGIEMPIYIEPHTFRPLDMSSFGSSRGWPIKASISMFGGRLERPATI